MLFIYFSVVIFFVVLLYIDMYDNGGGLLNQRVNVTTIICERARVLGSIVRNSASKTFAVCELFTFCLCTTSKGACIDAVFTLVMVVCVAVTLSPLFVQTTSFAVVVALILESFRSALVLVDLLPDLDVD